MRDGVASRPSATPLIVETDLDDAHTGACVWFTGLSGSGKTTTATILGSMIKSEGRYVTMLDGDTVRTHLSDGLGFSRADRDTNIRRIGFVAREIVRHGGLVVCATVSPYRSTRDEVRALVGSTRFIEVFVDTPLEECERRDVKGLYARARAGELTEFTGVDDPYEPPIDPELVLDDPGASAQDNANRVLDELRRRSFLGPSRVSVHSLGSEGAEK